MIAKPNRRSMVAWTYTKSRMATILFALLATFVEYTLTLSLFGGIPDTLVIEVPFINIGISPMYHLLPASVIVALTASFSHFTTQMAIAKKAQRKKVEVGRKHQKIARLNFIRRLSKRVQKAAGRMKRKILETRPIAYLKAKLVSAKVFLKGAVTTYLAFVIITLLITIAAYPELVPSAVGGFYEWNNVFLGFVISTIRFSEAVAHSVPPLGILATSINEAFVAVAPSFHNSLEGAASSATRSLVSLSTTEKYLIAQYVAAWMVALATLLYKYARPR